MNFLPVIGLLAATLPLLRAESPAQRWQGEAKPILENYCYDCHGDGLSKGELDFDDFESIEDMIADRERWKRIRGHIDQQLMPPPDEAQPTRAERDLLVRWIDDAIFPVDPEHPDPGRVTLRRLNRIEYENTLEDLLGVQVKVRDLLPPDDSGYGFDNIGDVLTLSPLHLERFLEAARVSLDQAVRVGPMPFPQRRIAGRDLEGPGQRGGDGHYLLTNGEAATTHRFAQPGTYRIVVAAAGTRGGDESPRMRLSVGDRLQQEWEVQAGIDKSQHCVAEVRIEGPVELRLAAAFLNDFWDADHPTHPDRNLLVRSITIEGPLEGPRQAKPQSHRRIYGERPAGASDEQWALQVFERFARRAFRRPVEPGEAERYLHFVRLARQERQSLELGIRHGLEAMLVSPAFLFREEPQPEPDNADRIHPVDEHTLASRLSYFLWSTMPDEELMKLADEGRLREQLDAQIVRMLDHPKARRLVVHFTGQWLQLRDLEARNLHTKTYPKFRHKLRAAMRAETEHLFAHLVRENRPLTELLAADYTFVDEQLARHYGIGGVKGDEFRKVSLEGTPRRGLLGHGSFHLITSHPTRTSPVLRGKFVLENILNQAPPPPPPNIPQLDPTRKEAAGMNLRQQMELHRDKPDCRSCHALMDPIGFGLENFDADGSFRAEADGKPVDASGELASGRRFTGADELREILIADHRTEFHRAVASKMLTYAIGRGVDWYDKPAIDQIVRDTEAASEGARDLIRAVIHSVPFQKRRGEG